MIVLLGIRCGLQRNGCVLVYTCFTVGGIVCGCYLVFLLDGLFADWFGFLQVMFISDL